MIPEAQRKHLLRVLALSHLQRDELLQRYKETTGKELTSQELDQAITNLRKVRGV